MQENTEQQNTNQQEQQTNNSETPKTTYGHYSKLVDPSCGRYCWLLLLV